MFQVNVRFNFSNGRQIKAKLSQFIFTELFKTILLSGKITNMLVFAVLSIRFEVGGYLGTAPVRVI